MAVIVLWLTALVFTTFGCLFLLDPAGWSAKVDVQVPNATARSEIRAMYGGLELGIAAFLIWCALDPARVRMGLIAGGCMLTGLAAGRALAVALEGGGRPLMYGLVAIEVLAAVVIFGVLRYSGRL